MLSVPVHDCQIISNINCKNKYVITSLSFSGYKIQPYNITPHSEVLWDKCDHILLPIQTQMCPGPHYKNQLLS